MDLWTEQSRELDAAHLWNLQHLRNPSCRSRQFLTPPSAFMNMRLMDLRQCSVPLRNEVWTGLHFLIIECLALANNRIEELPDSLADSCPNLRGLSIVSNNFRSFPAVVLRLSKLEYLSVSDNPALAAFPPSIGTSLPSLRTLYASTCGLQELPQSLLDLLEPGKGHLREFIANYNDFSAEYTGQVLEEVQRRSWQHCRYFSWKREDWPRYYMPRIHPGVAPGVY
eukprot:Plantae.Rhodophyta-Rhodochaete_pulchella.ctg18674.p2 GENE.Plantae.Rhodophyta-Rhodochaete_pulchella.ctg18674~~Plantae.Rhodophyta-Rhodochaete_pulchella.ctg18674.p2  ORF type:complete len:242 (+),score=18.69 Plantae.Rhodophyta-Rhodochaete_pulchella.ctg18674:54-728(+)